MNKLNSNWKEVLSWREFTPSLLSPRAIEGLKKVYREVVIDDTLTSKFKDYVFFVKVKLNTILYVLREYGNEIDNLMERGISDQMIKYYEDLYNRLEGENYEQVTLEMIENLPMTTEMWLDRSGVREYLNPDNLTDPFQEE